MSKKNKKKQQKSSSYLVTLRVVDRESDPTMEITNELTVSAYTRWGAVDKAIGEIVRRNPDSNNFLTRYVVSGVNDVKKLT